MKKNFGSSATSILVVSIIGASALITSSCMVKPPDDGSNLGTPTNAQQIQAAILQAQSGVTQDQAYHVGDYGTLTLSDNIIQSSIIEETHILQVTEINPKYIFYSDHTVETGASQDYEIARDPVATAPPVQPKSMILVKHSPVSFKNRMKKIFTEMEVKVENLLPLFPAASPSKIADMISGSSRQIARTLNKIEIEKSTAMGDDSPQVFKRSEGSLTTFENSIHDILKRKISSQNLSTLAGKMHAMSSASPTPSASPSASPAPVATATPSPSTSAVAGDTISYYGLTVTKHKYTTTNCSQLPGCTANATRLQFVEIDTAPDGSTMKLNWTYEVSNQVPGNFMILDQCFSTVVTQNDNQLPLTKCAHVGSFIFGSGTISQ